MICRRWRIAGKRKNAHLLRVPAEEKRAFSPMEALFKAKLYNSAPG
jgi:hypothetical protein